MPKSWLLTGAPYVLFAEGVIRNRISPFVVAVSDGGQQPATRGVGFDELGAPDAEARHRLLLEHPPLGLAVQRQRDELFLVSALEVSKSVERHLGHPRALALSKAALEVLAVVASNQPITRAGIDRIRGTSSDSALDTLLAGP